MSEERTVSSNTRALLESVLAKFKEADDERHHEQKEWEDAARKWKAKGDMYGCNFHQGMASGANWVALFFFRVQRELEALIKATPDETCEQHKHWCAKLAPPVYKPMECNCGASQKASERPSWAIDPMNPHEDGGSCPTCGTLWEVVRPGKWQPHCGCYSQSQEMKHVD